MPTQPLRGDIEKRTEPLLTLGSAVGRGAHCLVVEAQAGAADADGQTSRLAVKMFSSSHAQGTAQLEAVMREVHVLRQLNHPHVVKLCDVIEMVDKPRHPHMLRHIAKCWQLESVALSPLWSRVLPPDPRPTGRCGLHCHGTCRRARPPLVHPITAEGTPRRRRGAAPFRAAFVGDAPRAHARVHSLRHQA
mmetsp:Transcript_2075/g.5681  ORF Transcript_2075/g.5681 Transcript_2075/m.5681 type:complete len:191 (+) Transcript_2075:1307-1879(+)